MTDAIFDGEWRLLEVDPITQKQVWILDEGKRMRVRTLMPVDNMLDMNAEQAANSLGTRWGDGQPVARLPMHVWQRQLAPAINDGDEKYVRRWLNDSDHSKFRTRAGKV
jgi:hypothetical protein